MALSLFPVESPHHTPTTSWLGLIIIQHLLQLIPAIIIAKFANLITFNYGGMLSVGKLVRS